ncbi:hypothetical protein PYH72_02550 [Staphylococcus delphini]|uniref:hypothetical protein n=1 Tax=Staphylococcus delphini TaxID=53344 RepID=UPI003364CD83
MVKTFSVKGVCCNDCYLGLAFLGADPTTNQRFHFNVIFVVEALMDFPGQLIPQESRPESQTVVF